MGSCEARGVDFSRRESLLASMEREVADDG